jgi:serine O-acetyltransferase
MAPGAGRVCRAAVCARAPVVWPMRAGGRHAGALGAGAGGIGFLDPAAPKKLMPRLNQLFNRAGVTQEEIHILRGVAKAMLQAGKALDWVSPNSKLRHVFPPALRHPVHPRPRPGARSTWEVLTCYPGLHALVLHRPRALVLEPRLQVAGALHLACRALAHRHRDPPRRKIGERVFFDHAMGVVVGETAEIGDGCTIYQGVTLGGTSLYKGAKRHPTLGRDVVVSAGAKVLGGFTVGDGAKIGSNAVVIKPVPAGATAVGNPARIIPSKTDARARRDHAPSQSSRPTASRRKTTP